MEGTSNQLIKLNLKVANSFLLVRSSNKRTCKDSKVIGNYKVVTLICVEMFKKIKKVRNKNECFKALLKCNNVEKLARYQKARSETRKVVSEARSKAFEVFYIDLEIENGELKIYKLAKHKKGELLSQIFQ
ncbi:hypothetical protein CR513_48372, partial [Mucuna pruriens]